MGCAQARHRPALASRASGAGRERTDDRLTSLLDRPAMTTISLESLNAGDAASFVAALGDIYEHAPWVAQAVYAKRPFATLAALHDAMMSAVRAAPPRSTAGIDQGTSRSRRQGSAGGHDDQRIPRPNRRASVSTGCRKRNLRNFIGSTTPIGKNSASRSSSACAGTARTRSCGSSRAGCRTMWAPRPTRRSPKSSASPRCASISGLRPPTGSRCTAGCRPMSSTPMAAGRRRACRSSWCELSANGEHVAIARATTNRDGRTDEPLIAGRPLPIGALRTALPRRRLLCAARPRRKATRPSSIRCRCGSRSPSRRATITCRCW